MHIYRVIHRNLEQHISCIFPFQAGTRWHMVTMEMMVTHSVLPEPVSRMGRPSQRVMWLAVVWTSLTAHVSTQRTALVSVSENAL